MHDEMKVIPHEAEAGDHNVVLLKCPQKYPQHQMTIMVHQKQVAISGSVIRDVMPAANWIETWGMSHRLKLCVGCDTASKTCVSGRVDYAGFVGFRLRKWAGRLRRFCWV